ncbi:ubiquitin carboxyl-terminal hydrolase 16 [Nilaparvata lugens]|uniref:ubiquitin carboxyl-terminal hydrolase 16 n=1 Tax=Nilaparvata lugens TaxID=108931 RepID=UPI00193CA165|nr:ubiquitin carboxyl-terminal hydrolase 16 [Nilaparvata lugens]XP_039275477.1 ubiquitin carboxyl-terminal hydrolase 16 [Nilaparvata lugens]
MGKKKNRQNSDMAVNVDCTEPWDATKSAAATTESDESCKHILKVLKRWKISENFKNSRENLHCGYCKASSSQTDSKKSLQLCLSCGASSCGSDGENHAKHHADTPRSDSHYLTIDLESLSLWCYGCNIEPIIPQKCRPRIDEIIEKIKNVSEKHQPPRKPPSNSASENKVPNKFNNNQFLASNKEDKKALPVNSNKVKGLSNLGNTCFFNSVLQCLAQTPGLAECLREMQQGGEQISINPKDSEPITGTLEKGGEKNTPVSGALLKLISEMVSSEEGGGGGSSDVRGRQHVVVPRALMTELGKKCPQLMDGDQHDSHELLRQLLDVVFNEDLKRYRGIILDKYGLRKAQPGEVSEEKRKWLKGLDNLVVEQFVMKPYEVFRGTLVSELQCEECLNISSREENFLDLSLPVNVEKPQPPAFARRKYMNQTNSMNGKLPLPPKVSVEESNTEEAAAKSPKRGNRRGVKRNFQVIRDHGEGSITEEEKKENDADVEDNVENGVDDQKEVFESGYSSEKPESCRTSPTTESRQDNGDADDSACASPSAQSQTQTAECSQQKAQSAAVSAALANLNPQPLALPYPESENSSDSAGSLRANPGFSSPDLSTESLQDIGLLSQDDSQSYQCPTGPTITALDDNTRFDVKPSRFEELKEFDNTRFDVKPSRFEELKEFDNTRFDVKPSRFEELKEFDNTRFDVKPSRLELKELDTSFRAEDVSQATANSSNSKDHQSGDRTSCLNELNSALKALEADYSDCEQRGYNSGPTIDFESELKALEDEICTSKPPCLNNLAEPESGDCSGGLTITPIDEVSDDQLEAGLPCLDYITPISRSKESEEAPCGNLVLRLSEEEQASKSVCFNESVMNSRPGSRMGQHARSSPVGGHSTNPPVDGGLVEKFLEDMILTEKLNNGRASPPQGDPPSNSGHLGFVLVGGITATATPPLSSECMRSVKPASLNICCKDEECEAAAEGECEPDVSAEVYKKHMTLAPRYQCEEGECSVLSCLNHFTAIEMMAGNNKAGCDMCTKRHNKGKEKDAKTVYTNSTKRLLISKPPPILILHLKRFQVQMRSFRKLSCHVTFPLVLDIAPFCSKSCEKLLEKGQTQLLYSLYGVVEHSGTLHGGHYVAYVKVREGEQKPNQPREGSWYYISDSHVSPVKEEAVLRTQAYLLFYERIM